MAISLEVILIQNANLAIESPRWYLKKNRYQKAYRAMCRIRNSELQAAKEIYFAHTQLVQERAAFEGKSIFTRASELFTVPRIRRATVASGWIVISQQFSGEYHILPVQ